MNYHNSYSPDILYNISTPYICFFQTTTFSLQEPSGGAEKIAVEIIRDLSRYYPIVVLEPNSLTDIGVKKHSEMVYSLPAYEMTEHIRNRGNISPDFCRIAREVLQKADLLVSLERVILDQNIKRQIVSLGGVFYPHCRDVMHHAVYDRLIVPSEFVGDYASANGVCQEKIEVVYNGIDTNAFYTFQRLESRPIDFLIASRPGWEKGYKDALDIIRRLNSACGKKYYLSACMDESSSFASELSYCAEEMGVGVHYIGWQNNSDMPALFNQSRCILSVGIAPEGFGLSVIEAIACGACVVSRKIGFVASVLPKEHGLIYIEDFDLDKSADCFELMNCIQDSTASQNGMNYIRDHYPLDRMLKKYRQLVMDFIS